MSETRLRHVMRLNPRCPEFERESSDSEVTFLPLEAVWPDDRLDLSRTRTKGAVATGYTRFQDGDVLVPKITPTFEASRSVRIDGLVNGVGAGTTELHVLRSGSEIEPRFLLYLVRSHHFLKVGEAEMHGVAGQKRVPDEFVLDFTVDLPPLEEQRRIADFLDAETARINRVIKRRRAQVELVQARFRRRALGAVGGVMQTGGRRESGLRWLGTVPASWPVAAVSSQYEVLLGKMLDQGRVSGEHLKSYLRNMDVQWDRVTIDDLPMMDFPPHERQRYKVLPGDLLICEGGEPGRAAIWDGRVEEIYYQKALHRARPRGHSSPRWLYYCLLAATTMNVFAVEGNRTTIAHLTGEQLRAQRFPFPPRIVQDRIVSRLDEEQRKEERLCSQAEEQIRLLDERRRALITAAVTGAMDVTTARGVG